MQKPVVALVSLSPSPPSSVPTLLSLRFLLATYAISGTFQANLFLAVHEVTHNLAFSDYKKSRLLAMVPFPSSPPVPPSLFVQVANMPLVIPYCITFKPYHQDHHKYQGDHVRFPLGVAAVS